MAIVFMFLICIFDLLKIQLLFQSSKIHSFRSFLSKQVLHSYVLAIQQKTLCGMQAK